MSSVTKLERVSKRRKSERNKVMVLGREGVAPFVELRNNAENLQVVSFLFKYCGNISVRSEVSERKIK